MPVDRKQLILDHLRLVPWTVNRLTRQGRLQPADLDDLQGAGAVELVRCAGRFDPERGFRFSTYATSCIRGAVLRELDRQRRRTAHRQLPPDAVARDRVLPLEVTEALDALPAILGLPVRLHYLGRDSCAAIAEELGTATEEAVSLVCLGVAELRRRLRPVLAASI